jgi:hypothetical protein
VLRHDLQGAGECEGNSAAFKARGCVDEHDEHALVINNKGPNSKIH